MLKFIMRLDDATPKMNRILWNRVELLFDKYNIKPIVGVIPDSNDTLFIWDEDKDFWNVTVQRWQKKGWTIAQHGLHHVYHDCGNGIHSEFIGLSYEEQMRIIKDGYGILKEHNCIPSCFFAPGHTFDDITVDVCRDSGFFKYISDGYAIYPYKYRDMLFIPSIFDTVHKILPFGIYTFIIHPSFVTESEMNRLENFLKKHNASFVNADDVLDYINCERKISVPEKMIHPSITFARKIRKKLRG